MMCNSSVSAVTHTRCNAIFL